jgi:hypothetical protein
MVFITATKPSETCAMDVGRPRDVSLALMTFWKIVLPT